MSDLLKQAIADAKAIREAAIENAKATLAESFAPQIKSMIKTRLMEVDDLNEYDEDEVTAEGMSTEHDEEDQHDVNEVNLDSIMEELEGEMETNEGSYGKKKGMMHEEDEEMMEEEDMEESYARYDEDIDILESILEELNEDLMTEDMSDPLDSALEDLQQEIAQLGVYTERPLGKSRSNESYNPYLDEDYDVNENYYLFEEDEPEMDDMVEPMEGEEGMEMPGDPLAGLTEDDVQEMSKGELRDLVLNLMHGGTGEEMPIEDMDGEMEGVPSEEEIKEAVEAVLDEMDFNSYTQLEESVLGPIGRRQPERRYSKPAPQRSQHSGRQLSEGTKETTILRKKLQESYNTVQNLQDTLNEVALINSKLLYTGKLFRTYNSLTENQKVTILEYFDRVDSEEDIKKLYNKFTTVLNRKQSAGTLTEGKKSAAPTRTRLTESTASRTAGPSTKPGQKIVEDSVITRWQELAGIIK